MLSIYLKTPCETGAVIQKKLHCRSQTKGCTTVHIDCSKERMRGGGTDK